MLGQLADSRGGLMKKRGMVFLRGFDTLMHTMSKVGEIGDFKKWGYLSNGG